MKVGANPAGVIESSSKFTSFRGNHPEVCLTSDSSAAIRPSFLLERYGLAPKGLL